METSRKALHPVFLAAILLSVLLPQLSFAQQKTVSGRPKDGDLFGGRFIYFGDNLEYDTWAKTLSPKIQADFSQPVTSNNSNEARIKATPPTQFGMPSTYYKAPTQK
jgi:hypothetical protein